MGNTWPQKTGKRFSASNRPIFWPFATENSLNILRILKVATIVFHRDQERLAGDQEAFLTEITKKQPYYKDEKTSLYEVEPGPVAPAFVIGSGWYATEKDAANQISRWTEQLADFDIYTVQAGEAILDFKAVAFGQQHTLKVVLNDRETETIVVPTELTSFQLKLNLKQGQNRVFLNGQEPALSPREVGQGKDSRKLSVQIRQVALTYS